MSDKIDEGGDPLAISDEDQRSLDHVAEVSKNARTTWFGLIGLLLFCGVTLAGVEDRDFFEYGVSTQLPLVGVSVPTQNFFWAAPFLVTGLFTYLHLYLDKLWKALARLGNEVGGRPVTEVVYPWLISDTALGFRNGSKRGLYGWVTLLVTLMLCWLVGPLVMFFFWWFSWAPHDGGLTTLIGAQLVWLCVIAIVSWLGMRSYTEEGQRIWQRLMTPFFGYLGVVFAMIVGAYGWGKTESGFGGLYAAQLRGAKIALRPESWKTRSIALTQYLREDNSGCSAEELEEEFDELREDYIRNLLSNDFSNADFRQADLREAFFAGASLPESKDLRGASLRGVILEGSSYWDNAEERIDLSGALLDGADLIRMRLEGANLRGVGLEGGVLIRAGLEGADLRGARLDGAVLWGARLDGAVLRDARLKGANLRGARLKGAVLVRARLEGADLMATEITDADVQHASVINATLAQSFHVTQNQLDLMFGDASTTFPTELVRPDHWAKDEIPKSKRYARWRDWALKRDAPSWAFPKEETEYNAQRSSYHRPSFSETPSRGGVVSGDLAGGGC